MNEPVRDFLRKYKHLCTGKILEVGSFDVNGGVRDIIDIAVGADMTPGKGVDLCCKAEELLNFFPQEAFDTVVTFETFEHTEHWPEALTAMWSVLKTGGWFVGTIASLNKGLHNYPGDFHRLLPHHLDEIFKGQNLVANEKAGRISHGWAVQKVGPLVDLSQIELIPILDKDAIAVAAQEYNSDDAN